MKANDVASQIVNRLVEIVREGKLEILERYPDDLLKHDRAILEASAYPGMQIAWMVGHCHTHMFPLGLHPEKNEGVTWVTNQAKDDRFFVIKIRSAGAFSVQELDRKQFAALQHTPMLYAPESLGGEGWLTKHGQRVGHVATQWEPSQVGRQVAVELTPVDGCSELDRFVLEMWGDKAASTRAHSLFTPRRYVWQPAVSPRQREAA